MINEINARIISNENKSVHRKLKELSHYETDVCNARYPSLGPVSGTYHFLSLGTPLFILVMFFWVESPRGLVGRKRCFGEAFCVLLQGSSDHFKWTHHASQKRWLLPTNPRGDSTQKINIRTVTAMKVLTVTPLFTCISTTVITRAKSTNQSSSYCKRGLTTGLDDQMKGFPRFNDVPEHTCPHDVGLSCTRPFAKTVQ
jgi:hypothetical protein